jgi:hypothetical protein
MGEIVKTELAGTQDLKSEAVGRETLEKLREIASGSHKHESYQALVEYHRRHMRGFYRKAMVARWELGHDLLKIRNGSVYGEKTLEKFVEDLNDPSFSTKLAYACAQFAEMFSPEELCETMRYEHVYWGVVTRLMRVKDREDRRRLMKALDSGEIQASKLDEELRRMKDSAEESEAPDEDLGDSRVESGEAGQSENPQERKTVTKGFRQLIEHCALLRKACKQAMKDLQNLDLVADNDEKYEEAVEVMCDAVEEASAAIELLSEYKTEAARYATPSRS